MIRIVYKTRFLRLYNDLPEALREDVKTRIELFRSDQRSPALRVHKLRGVLKDCYSFSVNYRYRVVFYYEKKNVVALLAVGDHSVYR